MMAITTALYSGLLGLRNRLRGRSESRAAALLLWLPLAAAPVHAATPTLEARTEAWVAAASSGLDSRAAAVLQQIKGVDRRLLALRAYLRAGDSLALHWSWSQQRLLEYPSTAEGKAAAADIDAAIAAFEASNPGFTLQVNRQPRSLELQLEHWNANPGVARVAGSLVHSLTYQFGDGRSSDPEAVRQALIEWTPGTAAPLAAPGLSAHGQGRAFDFQVVHDGRIIAGVDAQAARQQWDQAGWTRKLRAALVASGRPFAGPLQSPYEPWHYAYSPAD